MQFKFSGDRVRFTAMTREERFQSFKDAIIKHPYLLSVNRTLQEALREPGGASLIFVTGPTGVGKTTLKNFAIRGTLRERGTLFALQGDEEQRPLLHMEARPSLTGSFEWKDFLQSGMLSLHEQSIEYGFAFDDENSEPETYSAQSCKSRTSRGSTERTLENALRFTFETHLKRCRPLAVFIDDAQYLGRISGGGKQLQNQVDSIKSMADGAQTVFVLMGTYELLPLRRLSAQLTGSSLDLHFPRYGSTKEELEQFKSILITFQEFLPFEEDSNLLLKHWEYCYERSLGCVGLLHSMLIRAVHSALWADERALSEKYLKRSALSEADCYQMMREIYECEREFVFSPGNMALRQMLGLKPQVTSEGKLTLTPRRSSPLGKKRQALRDHME